jgi:SAM-dependent methyltransferase
MENEIKEKQEQNGIDSANKEKDAKKRFVSINDLPQKEQKIIEIFKKFKKKLQEIKPSLFLRPHNYQFRSNEYKPLFQYESTFPLKVKQEFAFIYDSLNFICYQPKDEEDSKNSEKYTEKIKNIFSILKEKGTLLLLIDEFHIENFFPNLIKALGEDYKTKLFINFYFLDTRPFLFLVSIQKMAVSEIPISIKDIKILITDFFSQSKMIGTSLLSQMNEYLKEPLIKMRVYRLQCEVNYTRTKTLHPGEFYEIRLKSSPLNSYISYIVTIHDSPFPENQKNKQCFAVSISYEITQDILFSKPISLSKMCEQLKAARLIAIESAVLNPLDIKDLAMGVNNEIQLMKPEGFTDNIQMRLWEIQIPKQVILQNEKYLIKDFDDKKNIRQIYFMSNKNILQGQIRTKLASKTNVANPPKGTVYYPIETQEKYKTKGVIQCIDDTMIGGFYEQSILCTVYYMDLTNFPRNTIKIMDMGAGIGTLSFYFYKLFKGSCEIDNIEKNKDIYEIGKKYFGFQNYDNENKIHWLFEEARGCVEKMANFDKNKSKKSNENKYGNKLDYYDLIFNEINEISPKEDTVPHKEFFNDSFLTNIKSLLKPYGIYVVNLMSKNYSSMYNSYLQLEKYFPSIYNIASEGGLSSIFFCFKTKIDNEEYKQKFKDNKDIIEKNNVIDNSVVKNYIINTLSKVQDMAEEKKKMEENSKRF